MILFKSDPFRHNLFIKKWVVRILGIITHRRYRGFNELKIEGSHIIHELPEQNILFISNHQIYFADVAAMFHVFNATLDGNTDTIKNVGYLWDPKSNIYYIATKETIKSSILARILSYAGVVLVSRTWRESGKRIDSGVNYKDIERIGWALESGWVITFPQGTTEPWEPIQKGTAHIIKRYRPLVVPVVINGFRRAFDKTDVHVKKKDVLESMVIKYPMDIDYKNDSIEDIVEKIEYAIEQHPSFLKVPNKDGEAENENDDL